MGKNILAKAYLALLIVLNFGVLIMTHSVKLNDIRKDILTFYDVPFILLPRSLYPLGIVQFFKMCQLPHDCILFILTEGEHQEQG